MVDTNAVTQWINSAKYVLFHNGRAEENSEFLEKSAHKIFHISCSRYDWIVLLNFKIMIITKLFLLGIQNSAYCA